MSMKQLAILAAVAAVLAAFWLWPRGDAEMSGGELLLKFNAGEVDRIEIRNEHASFYLARTGSGWLAVDSAVSGPADPDATAKLIDQLTSMKADRVISRSADNLARFELTPELAARVALSSGPRSAALLFGKPAPGYIYSYVLPENQNVVYLAKSAPAREIHGDASRLRLRKLFPAADKSARLELSNDTGSWVISGSDSDRTLNGRPADTELTGAVIDAVLALSADRVGPAQVEKRRPAWRISVESDSAAYRANLYAAPDGFDAVVDGRPDRLYISGWRITPISTKLDLLSTVLP